MTFNKNRKRIVLADKVATTETFGLILVRGTLQVADVCHNDPCVATLINSLASLCVTSRVAPHNMDKLCF